MTTGRRPLVAALALGLCLELAAVGNEDLQYALSLMGERQEYDQAALKLDACVKAGGLDQTDLAQALYYLGNCYTRLGKDKLAGETYFKLLKSDCRNERYRQDAFCFGGDAFFRAGEFSRAAYLYDQLLKTYPAIPQAQTCAYWKAECLARMYRSSGSKDREQYDAARKAYTEFTHNWPDSENHQEALLAGALLAYENREYKAARAELELFLKKYPKAEQADAALCYASESAYWSGAYKDAAAGFATLIENFPKSKFVPQALTASGWCAYELGEKEKAGEFFTRAAGALKGDAAAEGEAYLRAAGAYEEVENFSRALELYMLAQKSGGMNTVNANYRAGMLLRRYSMKLQDNAQKNECLQKAQTLLKLSLPMLREHKAELLPMAQLALAEVYLGLKDYTNAAENFGIVASEWPKGENAPYSLYQQAVCQAAAGKVEVAAETIRQLLSSYPESSLRLRAAYAMADYQQRLGKPEKGMLAYQWIADKGLKWAENVAGLDAQKKKELLTLSNELRRKSLVRLGEMELASGNLETAEGYLQTLVKEYPDSPEVAAALLRQAEVLQKEGKLNEAQAGYARAAEQAAKLRGKADAEDVALLAQIEIEGAYRRQVCAVLSAQKATGEEKQQLLRQAGKSCVAYLQKYSNDEQAKLQCERMHYYLAEALYGVGNPEAAAKQYRACYQAQSTGPLADACLFGLGWSLRGSDLPDAVKNLQLLLEKFPDSEYRSEAGLLLASCLQKKGDTADSVKVLDELSLGDKSSGALKARALLQKALAYETAGKVDEAVQTLKELIAQFPKNPQIAQARYNLSWLLQKQMDQQADKLKATALREEIQDVLGDLLTAHPEFAAADECALRLGEFSYEKGENNAALKQYQQALTLCKKGKLLDRIQYRIGCTYVRLSQQAKGAEAARLQGLALTAFRDSLQASDKGEIAAECAWRAGEILRGNGKLAEAAGFYARAVNQAKDAKLLAGARYGVALCAMDQNQPGKALESLKQILADKENKTLWHEANCAAGQACLMLGALQDSQEYFKTARGEGYGGEAAAKARLGLGEVALMRKEYRKAREEFRKVDVFNRQWSEEAAKGLLKAANASNKLGELQAAAKDLELLLKKYPDSSSAAQAKQLLAQNSISQEDKP